MDRVTAAKLAELAATINLPDCVLDVPTVEQETLLGRRKPNDAVGIARFLAAYRARVRLIEAAELLKAMAVNGLWPPKDESCSSSSHSAKTETALAGLRSMPPMPLDLAPSF